ncbi:MAG: hypothetical protein ACFCUI_08705 [Bernardetiaceae bacterium]
MKRHFLWGLCGLLLACNPDKEKLVDPNVVSYQTTQQSMLFFKNMRGMYYDLEEHPSGQMKLFRFSDRPQGEDSPHLNVVLVNNWRHDQAYVLLEPNAPLQQQFRSDTLHILWQDTLSGTNGAHRFWEGNKELHYRFATHVYNSILKGHRLAVWNGGDTLPLFPTKEEREAFRITMMDYYRVVKVF